MRGSLDIDIRDARLSDRDAAVALAERLAAFGPTTRSVAEIVGSERLALAAALDAPDPSAALMVAEVRERGVVGVMLLETRVDYFSRERHGHVAILAVAADVQGRGIGGRLLERAEQWARDRGYRRLTLSVFAENRRAKEFYAREQWQPELETYYKLIAPETDHSPR